MDFDNPKVFGDTSITDGLVYFIFNKLVDVSLLLSPIEHFPDVSKDIFDKKEVRRPYKASHDKNVT